LDPSSASLAASPVVLLIGMYVMSIVHEETAMVAGGYLITEHGLPALPVVLVLVAGVMSGDWGVYGLGVVARRVPALKRWLRTDHALRSQRWLDEHLLLVVVVARTFPGPAVLLPTFSGLGMMGVSFPRFALRSALVTALYVPAALLVTTLFGQEVVPRVGWWAWPTMFALSFVGIGGPWARPLRRRVFSLLGLGHGPARTPEAGHG
jgi:membrane protein DedA with SNARE-associated domain